MYGALIMLCPNLTIYSQVYVGDKKAAFTIGFRRRGEFRYICIKVGILHFTQFSNVERKIFMGILSWIIIGGIAGAIAKAIMKDSFSLPITIVVGIIGGLIGGWVFSAFGGTGVTGFNLYSLLVAVVGSVILLAILGFFQKR